MNSFSSNFKSGIFAFSFPWESLGLVLHHLEEREQTHGVLKRRKGQLLARADLFQVPLHRVKSSQHFPGSIQQFAGMGSQDLGRLMNFNRAESHYEWKAPNSRYFSLFKLAACNFCSTIDFFQSQPRCRIVWGWQKDLDSQMCDSTLKTGFKMALCINDSQNKFAQFTSEKLRGFISASSANSPWGVKVKLALFPSHTSSSPSSSVIKIMRTKLCLSYACVSSDVFQGLHRCKESSLRGCRAVLHGQHRPGTCSAGALPACDRSDPAASIPSRSPALLPQVSPAGICGWS